MQAVKAFLAGLAILPAIVGAVVIWHVFFDVKRDCAGEVMTNRIARLELAWLAISKPRLFCERFEWVCQDVQERHQVDGGEPPAGAATPEPERPPEAAADKPEVEGQ